ncbi:MAG: hydroxysqualene dehydroxylase HpnE [Castellaniella sp.]|uniref:hydroxysqualene dehydroxylase HpnE n=1 Tax=Castellaniella sp. TaxID=1955812 RepID=UPI002A362A0D|nr:hydroxysqualene dehydroxylase HpnE [Castellaniella sp.]MDY0310207.1 hydroxysqualene dehydroxylase HpnE [Castellaniella sp.]
MSTIAVVGAGWAGLAAAMRLRQAGHAVRVYEAAATPGGRARRIDHPGLGQPIDNGQHILLGAYTATLALMQDLGVSPAHALLERNLVLRSADGRTRLQFWPLPPPLHRLGVLLGSRGLDGWHGRRHLARVFGALDPAPIDPSTTVSDWLTGLGSPPGLMARLWEPLCLAAMNTPTHTAQARLFARVLADSLGAGPAASRLLIPRGSLHDLWPAHACTLLGTDLLRHRVRTIAPGATDGWQVDGQPHSHLILAVPAAEARRLLAPLPAATDFLNGWAVPAQSAIGTLTLRLARPWQSGHPMLLLRDDPARAAWGQWLFDRSASARACADQRLVHVVIGAADRYAGQDPAHIAAGVIAQIRAQAAGSLPPLPDIETHALVTERRATFDAVPGLRRPGTITPWPGLLLAGDWTDTAYPAVLEGAVRSGLKAADAIPPPC